MVKALTAGDENDRRWDSGESRDPKASSHDDHQFNPLRSRMSRGGFRTSKIVGHYKGRLAGHGLRRLFCGFVCHLQSNAVESLWPKTFVSKDGVSLGVRLVRPRAGSGDSALGCSAEKLLTNEQDRRARGKEQRAVSILRSDLIDPTIAVHNGRVFSPTHQGQSCRGSKKGAEAPKIDCPERRMRASALRT